ncbi:MAG: hypothetical protein KBD78_04095 [Oligoflexales bacterium]|nr:hypothetical protein [Oligoflexales bacterium]
MNEQKLDLDKIEEELKHISVFPWDGIVKYCTAVQNDISFISKAPQRISALVNRVRELESELKIHKRLSTLGCAMSLEAMELKIWNDWAQFTLGHGRTRKEWAK